jgi:hypothetical protein
MSTVNRPRFTERVAIVTGAASASAQGRATLPPSPTPTDVKPGSITCEDVPYPVGTGILLYGSRSTRVENNEIFGNFLVGFGEVPAVLFDKTKCTATVACQGDPTVLQGNQVKILANQGKLDKVLANQKSIEANQKAILANQKLILAK